MQTTGGWGVACIAVISDPQAEVSRLNYPLSICMELLYFCKMQACKEAVSTVTQGNTVQQCKPRRLVPEKQLYRAIQAQVL